MGGGFYSSTARNTRATASGYYTKISSEIFSKNFNNAMNPYNINTRESRDSKEHPESKAIILGLDVTGSMGTIPHYLVKEGLPTIMTKIIDKHISDPQILFLGIGDHTCDNAPLQVGQFESSDELLDKWLTTLYLEGGGGGNDGESYLLAWYFAARHTSIDCFEKRNQKGILITIGDEPILNEIPKGNLKAIMGDIQASDETALSLLTKASKMYNVYHIHTKETVAGCRQSVIDDWKQLLRDNLIVADKKNDIVDLVSNIVVKHYNTPEKPIIKSETKIEDMIL